jgi:hypothetical protein
VVFGGSTCGSGSVFENRRCLGFENRFWKTGFGSVLEKIIEQKSSRANAHANPRVANRAVRVPGWRALVLYGRKPSLYVNS